MAFVAPVVPATSVGFGDLAWGAASGVGTGVGMMFLFRGLSRGDMSVVVPVTAVGGVALPVLIGVTLLGDRPSLLAWVGIAVAIPALWLVTQTRGRSSRMMTPAGIDGLIASAGIAVQYIALAQAGMASGVWPVLSGRVAAVLTIAALAPPTCERLRIPLGLTLGAAATGFVATTALVFYLMATRQQLVAIAVVLSSLYPAIPVLLGVTVLRERLSWRQCLGLGTAGAAIGLLTTS